MKKYKILPVCLLAVVCFSCLFSGCVTSNFFPDSGTWYCEELQLYLNFGINEMSTVVVDGEEIDCVAGFMDGSKQVTISAQDFDSEKFKLGDLIFPGEFVSLSDSELVLRHRSTGELFVFVKIGDSKTRDGSPS